MLPESAPEDVSFLYRMEAARAGTEDPATSGESVPPPSLDEIGHAHIRMVLQKMNGNKTKAAEALGISRQTLRSRLSSAR